MSKNHLKFCHSIVITIDYERPLERSKHLKHIFLLTIFIHVMLEKDIYKIKNNISQSNPDEIWKYRVQGQKTVPQGQCKIYSGADTGFQSGGGRDFLGTKLFSGIRNKIQEKRYKTPIV